MTTPTHERRTEPEFHVVSGSVVREVINADRGGVIDMVRATYLAHHHGQTVNPNSYFLRFPDRPDRRIIALPAHLGGERPVSGLKWIASYPGNITVNLPRASAVLLLNDDETGYPFACLEAAQISAARTAASAVLAADVLNRGRTAKRLAFVGAGVIARTILDFFVAHGWDVGHCAVHDVVDDYAQAFAGHCRRAGYEAGVAPSLTGLLADEPDVVVFATTAASPYLDDPALFRAGQVVLNVSLRDLGPELILASANVVDDVDHCLTANTSPHLAEQRVGHRDFVDGTLAGVMTGQVQLGPDRPVVFSPFGLGVLDLAVGAHVYRTARTRGRTLPVPGFFGETERWSG